MSRRGGLSPEEVQQRLRSEFTDQQIELMIQVFDIKTEIGRPPDYRRHLNHVLSSTQPEFSRAFLNHLCDLSSRMRAWNKIQIGQDEMRSWLRGRKAMLYFTQPSSRTVQSFTVACQILGIEPSLVQDQQVTSSVKDEKELESIRTFSSYYDLIIMRSPISGLATQAAEYLDSTKRPIPVVNAGGGVMHHPTQALLDIYTLDREEKN